jgi:penicillin-binding protein 1C
MKPIKLVWQKLSRCQQLGFQVIATTLGLLLFVRALPYLAPIRADDLRQDDQAIEFSDRNGLPLGTLLTRDQDHTAVVPLTEVSPQFIHAILAAEDGRFFQHGPLDLRAVARAIAEAAQARRVVSGASTITMQLSRMAYPTPLSLTGKLQEIWTAWRLAAGLNHSEILQAYVNRLPMGGNVYGTEAAARVYFGISAKDLNLAQASLLAAIPNNPNRLNPYEHLAALKRRQRYVLEQMVRDRYITQTQAQQALSEAVSLQPRQQGILAAPHFLFWTARHLGADHPAQVRTTLDRPLQQFVEAQAQQVIQTLSPHNVHQAAALVIENATGEVRAYVGSTDYFVSAAQGQNDGVQALRQPGSTLKPFLYQLALEQKRIQPNSILADVPTAYAIPGARLYRPIDYHEQFQGPVRVRVALANSLNVPAVKLLETIGVPAFLNYLHQLRFDHLTHSPDYYGLGLTLGSGEVSLWELARAYVTLANQGKLLGLKTIQSGVPASSAIASTPPTLLSPKSTSWFLISDILSDRFARAQAFGVDSLLSLPFPAAVKTGTSSDFRDTWTVGYTADYTVATWVGNFNGEPMQNVSGVTGAAPLWNRIMLHLHEHNEPKAFSVPSGLVKRPICAISGYKPTLACPTVVQEYFSTEDLPDYQRQTDPFFAAITNADPNKPPQYRLNLPKEYNEWLARNPAATVSASTLKILSPHNGDYFLMAPSHSSSNQPEQLEFRLASASGQPVEWRINGTRLATASKDSFFWPMQLGQWKLQVKSGSMTDEVNFEVRNATVAGDHQGFSIRKLR